MIIFYNKYYQFRDRVHTIPNSGQKPPYWWEESHYKERDKAISCKWEYTKPSHNLLNAVSHGERSIYMNVRYWVCREDVYNGDIKLLGRINKLKEAHQILESTPSLLWESVIEKQTTQS